MTDWTIPKLVSTARAFDRAAQFNERRYYARNRRLAFTARAWARTKTKIEQ